MDNNRITAHLDFLRGLLAQQGLNPIITRMRFDEVAQRVSIRVTEPYMSWVREKGLADEVTGDLLSVPADILAVAPREDIAYLVLQRLERLLSARDVPSGLLWRQGLTRIPAELSA